MVGCGSANALVDECVKLLAGHDDNDRWVDGL